MADTDTEEESDEYENALEEVEIDQSSELYKTIVAAIIEDDQSLENEMLDDAFDHDQDSKTLPPPPAETGGNLFTKDIKDVRDETNIIQCEAKADIAINTEESAVADAVNAVNVLLEEAAGDVIKR